MTTSTSLPDRKHALLQKIALYQGYLQQDPHNCHLLIHLGDLQHEAGQFSQAKQSFLQCLALQPEHSVAQGRLANVLMSQSRFDEAIAQYQRLLDGQPDSVELLHNLALCQFYCYQFEQAAQGFERLVDHPITHRSSQFHLAAIAHVRNRDEQAIALCEALLAEQADDQVEGFLAVVEFANHQVERAQQRAQRVLARQPHNADAAAVLAMVHTERFESEQAGHYYDLMIEHSPYDARGWQGRGLLAMQAGEHEAARSHLLRAAQVLPKDATMWLTLGWLEIGDQDYPRAAQVFSHVLALNPNFAEAQGALAVALLMQGKRTEAQHSLKRAERLDKRCFSAHYARSLLQYSRGDKQGATRYLATLLESTPSQGRPPLIEYINRQVHAQSIAITAAQPPKDTDHDQ